MTKLTEILTSRKFWATLAAVILAAVGYAEGEISAAEAIQGVMLALGVYTAAQGVADAGEGAGGQKREIRAMLRKALERQP